jgi:acyl carrier protein
MDAEIIEKLTNYVVNNILKQSKRVLDPNTKLISSGLIDSFSLVDLAMFVEEAFDVKIEDSELNSQEFDSLKELAEMVEARRK